MSEPHPIMAQLAALRESAGLSRTAVARQIYYVWQSVGYWEAGAHEPCLDAVDAYARLFGQRLVLGDKGGTIVGALKQARLDAGMTQTDVAHKLGCALTTVCRWETGRRTMTLAKASAYAALVGLVLELREVPA